MRTPNFPERDLKIKRTNLKLEPRIQLVMMYRDVDKSFIEEMKLAIKIIRTIFGRHLHKVSTNQKYEILFLILCVLILIYICK